MVQGQAAKEEISQLLFFSPQNDWDHGGTSLLEMSKREHICFSYHTATDILLG